MKKKHFLLLALGAIAMVGCQNNEILPPANQMETGETAPVNFEFDARIFQQKMTAARTFSPEYTNSGFSIYAFRQAVDGSDYYFERAISTSSSDFTYNASTHKLTGKENLPIGNYRFIGAYGVDNQASVIQRSTLNSNVKLGDDLSITYGQPQAISEIFLEDVDTYTELDNYEIGLTSTPKVTVGATLKRAVGRVDVMFIAADKISEGNYQEKELPGGEDIFGKRTVNNMALIFKNTNNKMNLFGKDMTGQRTSSLRIPLTDLQQKVTIGVGTETEVGTSGYAKYDNIDPNDIIQGSAHVFGTYLFPNVNETANIDMEIQITLDGLNTRSINLGKQIPVEKNKVTLVKIYVLNGNNVGTTTVDFEYEIEVVWEDPNEVEAEIS